MDRSLVMLVFALGACRAAGTPGSRGEPAPVGRGIELIEHGDLEGGIAVLRDGLAEPIDDGSRVEAHRWIGHALTRLGDPEGALEEYVAALELAPSDPWLHYASGVSWNTMGEFETAAACFTRAIELDPRHLKSLQWRGECLVSLGDARGALADYTRALECIETADEGTLASWGETRRSLLVKTLELRAEVLDSLGEREEAARDRERMEVERQGPGGHGSH
jgi:tetratricopeptide (TPR) repeat protein